MTYERPEEMIVVQAAHRLVLEVYRLTGGFPKSEMFGLISQMRRAAVSVPANICEGKARGSTKEILRFVQIGRASLSELDYLVMLAKDLKYISLDEYVKFQVMSHEVGKMTAGMLSYYRKQLPAVRSPLPLNLKPFHPKRSDC